MMKETGKSVPLAAEPREYRRSLLTGVLAFAVGLPWCTCVVASVPGASQEWGQGRLKVSERAYYVGRVNRILDAWRGLAREVQRRSPASTGGSHYICLVVDTDKKELWVESDGHVLPEHHSDLPAGMDWSLYRVTQRETIPLPPLSRFRLPGGYVPSDQVLLLGENKFLYIYFSFSSTGGGSGYGAAGTGGGIRGGLSALPPGQTAGEKAYESLVVRPDDYEKATAGFSRPFIPVEPALLTENEAVWIRVEELLYREMARQVSRRRWQLWDLKIDCGPDCTGATAQIYGVRKGPLPLLSGKPVPVQTAFRIGFLGNDVWYIKSESSPQSPRSARLDLEFLVCAGGSIPEPEQATLLQQGRAKLQEMPIVPASKWWTRLPNGATVELVGICENPSAGKPWWGPDGSLLGYAPYATRAISCFPGNHIAYDMVWRVDPPQNGGLQMRSTPEGFAVVHRGQFRDRYGGVVDLGLEVDSYAFDPSRETTTLIFVVKNTRGEPADVTFKSISLVPGKNPGFAIEVAK